MRPIKEKEQKKLTGQIKEDKYTSLDKSGKKDPLEAAFAQLADYMGTFFVILDQVGIRKINHPIYKNVVENLIGQLLTTCSWLFNVAAIIEPEWLKKNILIILNQLEKSPFPGLIEEAKAQNLFNQIFKQIIDEIDDPNKYLKILFPLVERFVSVDPGLVKLSETLTKQKLILESYELLAKRNPLVIQHACEYLSFLDESNIIAEAIPGLAQMNRERRAEEIKKSMGGEGIKPEERKALEQERILLIDEIKKYQKEQTDLADEYGDYYYAIKKQNNSICSLIQMKCAWEEFVCAFEHIAPILQIRLTDLNQYSKLNNNLVPYMTSIIKIQSQIKKSLNEFQIGVKYAVSTKNTSLNSELLIRIFYNCRTSMINISKISQQPLAHNEEDTEEKQNFRHEKMVKKQLSDILSEFAKIITDFTLALKDLPSIESLQRKNLRPSLSDSFSQFLVSVSSSSGANTSSSSASSCSSFLLS